MLSIRVTFISIFSVWGMALSVVAQDCPTFTLPNNTVWMNDGSSFKCNPGYRTDAQTFCVNGEWETSPICRNKDNCENSPCLNNGTCIDGIGKYTCECLPGYYGKTCKGCKMTNGVFMYYANSLRSTDYNQEECVDKCFETAGCTASIHDGQCLFFAYPYLLIVSTPNVDGCINACYNTPGCTGFNFISGIPSLCHLINTTAGMSYTLGGLASSTTSERSCEDLFTENQ